MNRDAKGSLLEVCKGAATVLDEQVGSQHPHFVQLSAALPSAIQQAIDQWSAVHDAIEGAERAQDVEPKVEGQS